MLKFIAIQVRPLSKTMSIRVLLEHGVPPNEGDSDSETPVWKHRDTGLSLFSDNNRPNINIAILNRTGFSETISPSFGPGRSLI